MKAFKSNIFMLLSLVLVSFSFACGESAVSGSSASTTSELTPSLIFSEDDGSTEIVIMLVARLCGDDQGKGLDFKETCDYVCDSKGGVNPSVIDAVFEEYPADLAQKLIDYLESNQCALTEPASISIPNEESNRNVQSPQNR